MPTDDLSAIRRSLPHGWYIQHESFNINGKASKKPYRLTYFGVYKGAYASAAGAASRAKGPLL